MRRAPLHAGTPWALALAVLGAALAIASGLQLPETHHPAQREAHEQAGWILGALLAIATPLAWWVEKKARWIWSARAVIIATVVAALIAGHRGGVMTWGAGWLL